MKPPELPPSQKIFLAEWLIDHNATRAYRIAYNYNGTNASTLGCMLLAKLKEYGYIDLPIEDHVKQAITSATRLLQELTLLSTVDISDIYDDDGNIKPIKDIPEDVRRAISSVEVIEDVLSTKHVKADGEEEERINKRTAFTKKLKFWDKERAAELLMRHLGELKDTLRLTGPNGEPLNAGAPVMIIQLPHNGRDAIPAEMKTDSSSPGSMNEKPAGAPEPASGTPTPATDAKPSQPQPEPPASPDKGPEPDKPKDA